MFRFPVQILENLGPYAEEAGDLGRVPFNRNFSEYKSQQKRLSCISLLCS